MEYLYNKIRQNGADYDGFFIFDADNVVDCRYISEMNKVFTGGADIAVGYRNTKNFGESWVSACCGIYYLYESEFANRPRDLLGTSCFLSGTGCLFSREYLERSGGWIWTGLTEDLECTLNAVGQGEKIAYCHDAVTYDEQPCRMSVSVTQRIRWVRGYIEAVFANRQRMVSALFRRGGFAVYDFMMNFAPFIGTLLGIALEVVKVYLLRAAGASPAQTAVTVLVDAAALYMGLYAMGAVTLIVERKRIRCSGGKLLLYSFTFPLFMLSYLPVCVMAIVRRPQWTHIAHNAVLSIEELS
jgi:cellulose synthase/poly-beta-1,6-N-acetylglucosamine synthase-like glycosyltransferase